MSILIYILYLCSALLSLACARPHQHSGYHNRKHPRRHHVHQHLGHTSPPGAIAQYPIVDLEVDSSSDDSGKEASSSGVMITVSFISIPQWPKSGEQVEFLVIPLNRWITPEEVSGLPHRPHKAHIISAKVQGGAGQPSRPYQHDDRIMCRVLVKGSNSGDVSEKSGSNSRTLSFQLADGEVNFEDPVAPWFLEGRTIERFGCF